MKKFNEKGFTLIEMLVVIFIISLLLVLVIPGITKVREGASDTGCEAYAKVVQNKVETYLLNNPSDSADSLNSMDTLVDKNIIMKGEGVCKNGKSLTIVKGEVKAPATSTQ
ncbi:MAG: competence type IV pilus major pilin ComGC [Bacilli bacterium]